MRLLGGNVALIQERFVGLRYVIRRKIYKINLNNNTTLNQNTYVVNILIHR